MTLMDNQRYSTQNQRQASALLPWYVNGTLSAGERQMVEDQLLRAPVLRQKLQVWQCVAQAMRSGPQDSPVEHVVWLRLQTESDAGALRDNTAELLKLHASKHPNLYKLLGLFLCALCIACLVLFL